MEFEDIAMIMLLVAVIGGFIILTILAVNEKKATELPTGCILYEEKIWCEEVVSDGK